LSEKRRAAVEKAPRYYPVRLDHTVSESIRPPLQPAPPHLPAEFESEPAPSIEAVQAALAGVIDPELGADIVTLGMVRDIALNGGAVSIEVALTVAACPLRDQLRADVERQVRALSGVESVDVRTGVMDAAERSALMARARLKAQDRAVATDIPMTAKVLAVASGKGGVGKSSISVNLSVALARRGLVVGLLDADVWGHSVPRLLGMDGELRAEGGKMIPFERAVGSGLLKVISMSFLSGEEEAIMWRGLMLNRAVQHFLEDVRWGSLDYLVIDLPPGTGDVQMGLARMIPRTELLVVTTPNKAARTVAGRAADMARRGHVRVAGVIENMSAFTCEHGETYEIFGSGGGQRLADQVGVPLIGTVPLDASLARGGETGEPVALDDAGPLGAIFATIAERVVNEISPLVEMGGCSARLLERVEEALGPIGA
jgi:ATP-binding protein involved in chromosome partitioning